MTAGAKLKQRAVPAPVLPPGKRHPLKIERGKTEIIGYVDEPF